MAHSILLILYGLQLYLISLILSINEKSLLIRSICAINHLICYFFNFFTLSTYNSFHFT